MILEHFLLLGLSSLLAGRAQPVQGVQHAQTARSVAGVNAKDSEGRTPLMRAVLYGDAPLVEILLEAGADPNLKDLHGNTALVLSEGREPRIVRALVAAGANVNLANDEGRTPLIAAAQSAPESVRLLLEKGADESRRDRQGLSALTIADAAGASEIAALLREAGATSSREERLHEAIRAGDEASVKLLIEGGVNPNSLDTDDYQTPLMAAVKGRKLAIVQDLIDAGADPTAEGTGIETTGDNAILVAARDGSPWALRLFLEKKTRREDLDRVLLVGCADAGILRVALDAGARVNVRGPRGETPLQCAATHGSAEAVELLLAAGADPGAKDEDGSTAMERAERAGHTDVAALLKKAASSRPE